MLNNDGQTMPSALIPFCFFGSIAKGVRLPNISLRVCDLFDPVVYNGKLCYQMDTAEKMPEEKTFEGNGLTLVIDVNSEKSVTKQSKHSEDYQLDSLDVREASANTDSLCWVSIGTLAPFHAYGPGSYALTSVKQIDATDEFLSMSKEKRKCEQENFQNCQERLFNERIKQCDCVPQSLFPALKQKSKV